jgi:hypothetical protein
MKISKFNSLNKYNPYKDHRLNPLNLLNNKIRDNYTFAKLVINMADIYLRNLSIVHAKLKLVVIANQNQLWFASNVLIFTVRLVKKSFVNAKFLIHSMNQWKK